MPATDLYGYARMSNDVYTKGSTGAPFRVLREIRSGNFTAKVYALPGHNAVISFAGTDDKRDAVVEDAIGIGLTGSTMFLHTTLAFAMAKSLKASYNAVEVCGHSLGGAYAQLVAREFELTCVTFNAPGAAQMARMTLPGGAFNPTNLVVGEMRNAYAAVFDKTAMFHFRHPQDVVSRIGNHCGLRPVRDLRMQSFGFKQLAEAHKIAHIEQWLKPQAGRAPTMF
jgi:hypothetical protein